MLKTLTMQVHYKVAGPTSFLITSNLDDALDFSKSREYPIEIIFKEYPIWMSNRRDYVEEWENNDND